MRLAGVPDLNGITLQAVLNSEACKGSGALIISLGRRVTPIRADASRISLSCP